MRRLYSTFAGGWPGIGLLLLRIAVGGMLIVRTGLGLWSHSPTDAISLLLAGAGVFLIPGLWTPIVGTFVALIETWQILNLAEDLWTHILLGTISAALAMLGPGFWSLDARIFGWKRIEASPRRTN